MSDLQNKYTPVSILARRMTAYDIGVLRTYNGNWKEHGITAQQKRASKRLAQKGCLKLKLGAGKDKGKTFYLRTDRGDRVMDEVNKAKK